MYKILSIAFLFLICNFRGISQEDFRKTAPPAGPAPRIELGKAEQITLKNGLKIIAVENHKLPTVTFRIFVDAPPVLEGEFAGYRDMAGQLLRMGTTTRTKAEIDEAIDFLGAEITTDATGITGTCLKKHQDKLLEIMADLLFHPSFPENEFEKLRKQKISELSQNTTNANFLAANVSSVLRNGTRHPYGEVVTEASLSNITVEKCREYYDTYFKSNISYFIVTGDIKARDALDLGSKYFSKWEGNPVLRPTFPTPSRPESTEVSFVDKPGAVQSVIYITYPVELKPGTPESVTTLVLNTLLGGYSGSRLNLNLREDKGYTYGPVSALTNDPLIGSFAAYASVRNEVTDSSITEFLKEIHRLRDETVSETELTRVKNVIIGSFARALEDPSTVANYQLNTIRYGFPADFYTTYLEKVAAVTPADIQKAARTYLMPDHAHILVVGNKEETSKKLMPFSKTGRIEYYDPFGRKVEEVSLPVPKGITSEVVLADYLSAIGGVKKLNTIQNVIIAMQSEIQGMTIETVLYHKAPNQLSMSNKMMGNIVQQSIFDGTKGSNIQMGTVKPMEGVKLEDMKVDSRLFPERYYHELGVTTEITGIEIINGRKAYKILIKYPSGTKKTQYFDIETSLKVREIEQEGDVTVTNDIGDYKEVDGIKFPHTVTVSGAMPIPLTLKTIDIQLNTTIDEALFKIE